MLDVSVTSVLPGEAKKRQKTVSVSWLQSYRSVRGPHFSTAPRPRIGVSADIVRSSSSVLIFPERGHVVF